MPTFKVFGSNNVELGKIVQHCESSDLILRVVSQKDKNQVIPFKAKLYRNSQMIASSSAKGFVLDWKTPKLTCGYYTVEVLPKSENTFSDYKSLGYGSDFETSILVNINETKQVTAEISRKESILHDIKYEFYLLDNNNADETAPIYELEFFSTVSKNSDHIADSSERFTVSERLIKSIMYMETTHGYYDAPLDLFDINKSIRPMNVNVEHWSKFFTREELYDKQKNIHAGAFLLRRILDRVSSKEISKVATLYNHINAIIVNDYGARVKKIYDEYLYIPPVSFFDQIHKEVDKFERLSPLEQYNILCKMFGG